MLRVEIAQVQKQLSEQNSAQLKVLEDGLTKRITEQEHDLKTRSDYQFQFAQGLASSASNEYANARDNFRAALKRYKSGKPKELIPREGGVIATRNIFVLVRKEDEANHVENAKSELANELYVGLEEELALAAVDLTWLGPLLPKRKKAPSTDST